LCRYHLAVLHWARAHDCPWEASKICAFAARGGHLAVLQWAREQGCEWAATTCSYAAAIWRCRLPVSKPELKARLVSALETNM
jgi:hypothetical protein